MPDRDFIYTSTEHTFRKRLEENIVTDYGTLTTPSDKQGWLHLSR